MIIFTTVIEHVSIDNDGLIKVVVLNYASDMGWRCGYVGVPEGHPLYGKKYEEIENDFEVNGGLTFSDYNDRCDKEAGVNNKYWYLGFDCAHAGDVLDRETKNKYNILSRDSDELGYKFQRVWDKENVIREVNNLALQIRKEEKKKQ